MALGRKSEAIVDNSNTHDITVNEKDHVSPQYQGGVFGSDPEKAEGGPKYRKMSRIGGPGIVGDSDTDSTLSVGKQLELEQSNSIKYRTCSWQKVQQTPFLNLFDIAISRNASLTNILFMHGIKVSWATCFTSSLAAFSVDPGFLIWLLDRRATLC